MDTATNFINLHRFDDIILCIISYKNPTICCFQIFISVKSADGNLNTQKPCFNIFSLNQQNL